MQGGNKYANLPGDVQMALKKAEEEARKIRAEIESKEIQRRTLISKIGSLKEVLRRENSGKKKEIESLEKEIQGKGIEERVSKKYASQLNVIEGKLAEINQEISRAVRGDSGLRSAFQEKPSTSETKVLEKLNQEKNQLQGQVQELKNRLQESENKLKETVAAIQRLSQKSVSSIPQKGEISTSQELRVRQAEKDKLEKEKEKIQKTISNEVALEKQKLIQRKETLERESRGQSFSSSSELQRLESSLLELDREIQALKGREGNLMRGIENQVSRMNIRK